MRKSLVIILLLLLSINCTSIKRENNWAGTYILQDNKLYQALSEHNYSNIEIHKNGNYTLNKVKISFSPVIEQCSYASKGKWSAVSDNVMEITSENYYTKQKGFDYQIKKENKYSQDSLYIQVHHSAHSLPLKLRFAFNYNKTILTDKTYIALPKSKYLWNRDTPINHINFGLNADISGTEVYKSRILFNIFDEYINTEKYNFLTINLLHFDRCFFEFEPYYQDFIYIKGKNKLLWKGKVWKK